MKLKHLLLPLLTIVIIGVCVASPFVISVFDNNQLLTQPITENAEAIDTTALNVEKRNLTHSEKIQLYIDHSDSFTSVTLSANKKNHTLLKSREAETIGKEELRELMLQLGTIPDDQIDAIETLTATEYASLTYIDQDDLSRHAIFWLIAYETEFKQDTMFASILMDDETGKIYQFAIGTNRSDWMKQSTTVKTLDANVNNFAKYLGLSIEWPEEISKRYYDFSGGNAYVLLRDEETGLSIPYEIGQWTQRHLTFTLPAEGNGIKELVTYYQNEIDYQEEIGNPVERD